MATKSRSSFSKRLKSNSRRSSFPALRLNKFTAVVFILVVTAIGSYIALRSQAADNITINLAQSAQNLTGQTSGPGPRLVTETDSSGGKRGKQVVYVQATSSGPNNVYAINSVSSGKYQICAFGRPLASGNSARFEVHDAAAHQDTSHPALISKNYTPNGTSYVVACVNLERSNNTSVLYLYNIVTSGAWHFSYIDVKRVGNVSPPVGTLPQPPPDEAQDSSGGRFRIACDFSHRAQVDPIVVPNGVSGHMHDFFGSTITSSDPSYNRMITGGSSCAFSKDTAAYWFPSLKRPDGTFVTPVEFRFYYRARPVGYQYGTNVFPPDFRMIAGGRNATDKAAYWTCEGESDTGYEDRKLTIPNCIGVEDERLIAHVFFPSCWDGKNLDSPDHRSHVAYGLEDGVPNSTNPETCPASHPYKIPQLDLRVVYPIKDGRGHILSDGEHQPHADFWNTWQQDALVKLVNECLRTGENCEAISD